jgi:adenine nucleotide transporter 17
VIVDYEKAPPSPVVEKLADDSFLGIAREIVAEEGVGGLWLGIKPGLVLTVNPAITYGVFERVKSVLLTASSASKLAPGTAFLVGALSKTLATIVNFQLYGAVSALTLISQVTYPYIMAKVRIQARSADSGTAAEQHSWPPPAHAAHHDGALDILRRVLKEDGPLGWYQVC